MLAPIQRRPKLVLLIACDDGHDAALLSDPLEFVLATLVTRQVFVVEQIEVAKAVG